MRIRYRYILLAAVLILAVGIIRKSVWAPYKGNASYVPIQTVGYGEDNNLSVVRAITQLRHGEVGFITIQGLSNTKYSIKSSFAKGSRVFNVVQQRTTDENGRVTFTWTVGKDTAPGVYPITITGGGKTLSLYHTVIQ